MSNLYREIIPRSQILELLYSTVELQHDIFTASTMSVHTGIIQNGFCLLNVQELWQKKLNSISFHTMKNLKKSGGEEISKMCFEYIRGTGTELQYYES